MTDMKKSRRKKLAEGTVVFLSLVTMLIFVGTQESNATSANPDIQSMALDRNAPEAPELS